MIYNALILGLLSILTFVAFGFVAGNPVKDYWQFALALFMGSLGFSIVFTFVSAIATKADNSGTLMAILRFPAIRMDQNDTVAAFFTFNSGSRLN